MRQAIICNVSSTYFCIYRMKEELSQLELALKQDQQPAERLNTLLQILEAVDGMDLPRSEMLANKAIGLATQLNAPASLAKAHGHAAAALWKLAEYFSAEEFLNLTGLESM